jgi:hypothetical protein
MIISKATQAIHCHAGSSAPLRDFAHIDSANFTAECHCSVLRANVKRKSAQEIDLSRQTG